MAEESNQEIELSLEDYKKVGKVYRYSENDYLICYNDKGLLSVNVDETESFYEVSNAERTKHIIQFGDIIANSILEYKQEG